jgi:hypothetical protein
MTDNNLPIVPQAEIPERMPRVDVSAGPIAPIVPRTLDEVIRVARMAIVANIIPDGLAKEDGVRVPKEELMSRVVAVIMAGSEVQMGPMTAPSTICLINNRRSIYGAGAVALLQRTGVLESYKVERVGPQPKDISELSLYPPEFGVRVTLRRKGQSEPYVSQYTVAQAQRAGMWLNPKKKPWHTALERMLQWRAFHIAAVDGFSDCLNGLAIAEVERDRLSSEPPKMERSEIDFLLADASQIIAEQRAAAVVAPEEPTGIPTGIPAVEQGV